MVDLEGRVIQLKEVDDWKAQGFVGKNHSGQIVFIQSKSTNPDSRGGDRWLVSGKEGGHADAIITEDFLLECLELPRSRNVYIPLSGVK